MKNLKKLVAVILLLLILLSVNQMVFAQSVTALTATTAYEIIQIPDNFPQNHVPALAGYNTYKNDPPATTSVTIGGVTINITINANNTFNWTSSSPVEYVFAKGGEGGGGQLYHYTPATTSGSGLFCGIKDNGTYYGLSHITFYWLTPQPTPVPPTDTPVPPIDTQDSPTSTPVPPTNPTPTPTPAITEIPATTPPAGAPSVTPIPPASSVEITPKVPGALPVTGGTPMSLLFGFGMMIALFGATIAFLPKKKSEQKMKSY